MVKKYRLTNGLNKHSGGGLEYVYPMIPSMTGLRSPSYSVSGGITMGLPSGLPMGIPAGMTGAPYASFGSSGLKVGVPLVSGDSNIKVIIPPKIDSRDPGVFLAVSSESKGTKTLKPESDINLTFKEAAPKRSLVMYEPTLGLLPPPMGINLPVGLMPGPTIVLNPEESKARLEISSPDSDDIMTISGDQDDIKAVFEGIQNDNKAKIAQNAVKNAIKTLTDSGVLLSNYTSHLKTLSDAEIDAKPESEANLAQKKAIKILKKAQEELKKAKKKTKLDDNDEDVHGDKFIPLTELFDVDKVKELVKKDFIVDESKFSVSSKKKNIVSMLFGMPQNGLNYGPSVSFS